MVAMTAYTFMVAMTTYTCMVGMYICYRELWEKLYSEIHQSCLRLYNYMWYVSVYTAYMHYLKMELGKQVVSAGLGVVVVVWSILYSCSP